MIHFFSSSQSLSKLSAVVGQRACDCRVAHVQLGLWYAITSLSMWDSQAVTSRSGPAGSCDQLVCGTNPVTSVIVPFLPVRALQSPAIWLTFYTSLFYPLYRRCLCVSVYKQVRSPSWTLLLDMGVWYASTRVLYPFMVRIYIDYINSIQFNSINL